MGKLVAASVILRTSGWASAVEPGEQQRYVITVPSRSPHAGEQFVGQIV
jgi:hypothetical protein